MAQTAPPTAQTAPSAAQTAPSLAQASPPAKQPSTAGQAKFRFDLLAQPMAEALRAVGRITGADVLFEPQSVTGRRAAPLVGEYTAVEAINRMLRETPLEARVTAPDRIAIGPRIGEVKPDPRPAGSSGSAMQLEGITVTATKREARLIDVPLSISAISNQEIERKGATGMEDYLRSIPGVNEVDRGAVDNAIVIRGITTSPQAENTSSGSTVATYFGETPITAAAGFGAGGVDLRPVDIERIEVLRGPQGTSFGNSSLGGALRIIPAPPKTDQIEGRVSANVSSTAGYGGSSTIAQGALNIPLVKDQLAVRMVGYRYDQSGFYRNRPESDPATLAFLARFGMAGYAAGHSQDNVGGVLTTGGRLAALWKPSADLDITVSLVTQKTDQNGRSESSVGEFEQARLPIDPRLRIRGQPGEWTTVDMDVANLVANYNSPWGKFTGTISRVGTDGAYVYATTPRFSAVYGPASIRFDNYFNSTTAEARFASNFEGPFQLLAGLYSEEIKDGILVKGAWPGPPAANPQRTDPPVFVDADRVLKQQAAFGELSYAVTDTVTGTIGGRFFRYDQAEAQLREGGIFGTPLGTGVRRTDPTDKSGSIGKAILSYQPDANKHVYASWSQGFRLGRADSGLPSGACDRNNDGLIDGTNQSIESTRKIDPDFLDNYEVGGKFSLLNRRLFVNSSIYRIEWKGLPIRQVAGGTCGLAYTVNAGAAKADGVELQVRYYVTPQFAIDVGGGYNNARLAEDAPGLNALKGARLPGSPKTTANLAMEYNFSVAGKKAFVRADALYVGEFYGNLAQSSALRAGDYVKVDARAGVELNGWGIEIFVLNLTNEAAYAWRGIQLRESEFGHRLRPRTIGLQVAYNFK